MGEGRVEEGKGDGDGKKLDLGVGQTIWCTDGVLENCALETCIVSNQCHPNRFNIKKERIGAQNMVTISSIQRSFAHQ